MKEVRKCSALFGSLQQMILYMKSSFFLILDNTCNFHKHKKYNIWFIEKNYKIDSGVYKENSKEVRGHHLKSECLLINI